MEKNPRKTKEMAREMAKNLVGYDSVAYCVVQSSLPQNTYTRPLGSSFHVNMLHIFDWGEREQLPTTLNKSRTTQCHIVQRAKIHIRKGTFFALAFISLSNHTSCLLLLIPC